MYLLDTNTLIYYFKGMGNVSHNLLSQPPQNISKRGQNTVSTNILNYVIDNLLLFNTWSSGFSRPHLPFNHLFNFILKIFATEN